MNYPGAERRRAPRITARFVLSYRVLDDFEHADMTQLKNLSLGGMLLTTNREFNKGTFLAIEARLPFDPYPIKIIGRVLDSKEVTKDLIFDTRIEFLKIDDKHRKNIVGQTIDFYLNKNKPKGK
ncbi:MAG: PilZ domain-containing protein [Candidatus Omnitrophica bacterium]|nr:PilZ domain-containing protein [Candidatus Omnitrophota bacterium]